MENTKSKILVVDDEPEIVDILRHFLSLKGYDVSSALNGREALGILDKSGADAVLLDILMPELKGTDLAKIIKQRYPGTKIIIITGYPEEGEVLYKENILEALFVKPLKLEDLYRKLLEVFNREEPVKIEFSHQEESEANSLFIKAKILFVEPASEVYDFLNLQFKELVHKQQDYDLDVAKDEKEIIQKINTTKPDIVIFDTSYYNTLGNYLIKAIYGLACKPKEVMLSDLSMAAHDYSVMEKLIENVRSACLKHALVKIR
jgi:DNA-binding response OmpR family regulator